MKHLLLIYLFYFKIINGIKKLFNYGKNQGATQLDQLQVNISFIIDELT